MSAEKVRTQAPALDHAMAIMDLLAASAFPLTLSEIARKADIPQASTYRVIQSLLQHGMISADPQRKRAYSVGAKVFQVASTIFSKQSLIPFFYPIAEILKNEIHQAIYLSVPVGNQMVVVSKVEPSIQRSYNVYVGHTSFMHRSSAGKALLSMHGSRYQNQYLASDAVEISFEQRQMLLNDLERAQRLGYSVGHGDFESLISTLSAPVLNLNNEPVATISVGILSPEFSPTAARQYSKNLIQAARQLSSRII